MGPVPSAADYKSAFLAIEEQITDRQRRLLEVHYQAPDQRLTASELASRAGFAGIGGAKLHYGIMAKLVRETLNFPRCDGTDWVHLLAIVTLIDEGGSPFLRCAPRLRRPSMG